MGSPTGWEDEEGEKCPMDKKDRRSQYSKKGNDKILWLESIIIRCVYLWLKGKLS